MSLLFMNAGNKITIKSVSLDDGRLPSVIHGAIGNPSPEKVLEVIGSYKNSDHSIIGAFISDILVGILGFSKTIDIITVRHISVLKVFQRQGVGTLLFDEMKKHYQYDKILAETDIDSLSFYLKLGFSFHKFEGKHGNERYRCELNS